MAGLKRYLPLGLHALSVNHPGVLSNPLSNKLAQDQKDLLTKLFQEAAVSQPFLA